MSISTVVFVKDTMMIGQREWSEAIRASGFEVSFSSNFDVRKHSGFLQCKYKGVASGFEYSYTSLREFGEVDQNVRAALGDRDSAAEFVTHSDLRELATAVLVASVLCAETKGVLWDTEGNKLTVGAEAIGPARYFESVIASELSR